MTVIEARQQQRYDTAANWSAVNPLLLKGEIGVESDTNRVKVGDGTSLWNSLPYVEAPISSLGDLTDINLSIAPTPQTGTPLIFSQGEWRTGPVLGTVDTSIDDLYDKVALSYHFNGENNSTIYVDSSNNNINPVFVTTVGSARLVDSNYRFGPTALRLNEIGYTTNSLISINSLNQGLWTGMGSGPFCVEYWMYIEGTSTDMYILTMGSFTISHRRSGSLWDVFVGYGRPGGSRSFSSAKVIPSEEWVHIAVTRDSNGTFRIYHNGIQIYTVTYSYTFDTFNNLSTFYLGARTNTATPLYSDNFIGYIDDFRLTIGVPRYTATSFTVPTAPNGDTLASNPRIIYTLDAHSDVDLTIAPENQQTLVWSSNLGLFKAGNIIAKQLNNSPAPSTATSTGNPGEIRYDNNFVYICTALNTWVRAPLSSW